MSLCVSCRVCRQWSEAAPSSSVLQVVYPAPAPVQSPPLYSILWPCLQCGFPLQCADCALPVLPSSPPGGNAGLAAAYIARELGLPITVIVPQTTPSFIADKLREEGASVEIVGKVSASHSVQEMRECSPCKMTSLSGHLIG